MKKTIFIVMTAITTTAAAFGQSTDEQAIQQVVNTIETGWAQKNGQAFSSVFADVHDFIVWHGYYFPGMTKQANAAAHQGLFDGMYKTYDVKFKIDKIRFIRPDIALAHVYGGGHEKGKSAPENPSVLMTMLLEKKDGSWKIISFHNLDLEAFGNKELADRSPIPLKVMYAGWYKK
ncbi:MAG TPA: SgcJ/EcaC family oxidoreductase [Chitinophagaceae bacterium]|nr:SgcJ/EcaC family oxidoreductase [Chitinophagaceae bacterium]